jgi:16S rRNA (guanine527-N7)-methyltransferase
VSLIERLNHRAFSAGLTLSDSIIHEFVRYFELLKKWNRTVSLTSLAVESDSDEALDRLLIEPALATASIPPATASLIDVGSGGGSPAIPIKLLRPEIALRMVESKSRKAAFLREAVRDLGLANTVVDARRVENVVVEPELGVSADVVTIRAVRLDGELLDSIQRLLRPGGLLLAFRADGAPIPLNLAKNGLQFDGSDELTTGSRLDRFRHVPRGTLSNNYLD